MLVTTPRLLLHCFGRLGMVACFAWGLLLPGVPEWHAVAAGAEPNVARGDSLGTRGTTHWRLGTTVAVGTEKIELSQPVNVLRSKGYAWFPTLHRRANGELLAIATDYPDTYRQPTTALACWSADGGLTWSAPQKTLYGDIFVPQPSGETIWLPYYLYHRGSDVGNVVQILEKNSRVIRQQATGLSVTGWPKPDQRNPKIPDLCGFVFNGDAVPLKDGGFLATLYGNFEGAKRSSLLVARSSEGLRWKIVASVAEDRSELQGEDGPSEASLCRLKDGRLLCVFRTASYVKFGQSFSADEGATWTKPRRMEGPFSVQPSLAVLEGGMVALSAGRPGLFLWLNRKGDAEQWSQIDLRANHNASQPGDYIHESAEITEKTPFHHARHETSSYTQTVTLDARHFLVVYDRGPQGGEKVEKISPETNSLWVVRVTVPPHGN